ncbi:MAG TPA: hydrolase [Caulobacteraceae bacterium]|nr:hydrolase [Caulobacteraceae bacterium]
MRLAPEDRQVLDSIASQGSAIVERAVDWCAINSGSRNVDGLERQRGVLVEALRVLPAAPMDVPLSPTVEIGADGRESELAHPPAIAVVVRPEAPVQVVLTGHYDTVYLPESRFQAVQTRTDGALNGPGIADMKGGISVMIAALQALEGYPGASNLGYRMLLSPDEEIGSMASAPLLADFGARGHVGMTYEPAMGEGVLAAERKGSGNFHIRIRGRAAHAGRDFAAGRNAIAAAARLAARLDELNGKRDGVTLNVARIDGGAPLNMVPDNAVLRFNARFPDEAARAWLEFALEEALRSERRDGIEVERFGGVTRPAKPFNAAQTQLFQAVKDVGALLGQPIAWKASGGVCEGNNLFAAGLPNVDTLGVRGGDIHSENEFAWPQSFVERAQLSALILMKLASGEIDAPAIHAAMGAA